MNRLYKLDKQKTKYHYQLKRAKTELEKAAIQMQINKLTEKENQIRGEI